ncbi:GNAT family N-acetyltransferase [Methanobrevibacter sp. OttesenSCG-928-K11]|nr:GNAT family N-acetyltransferase [Methanobrevibacter sp. OttesenSCG-928-K11]
MDFKLEKWSLDHSNSIVKHANNKKIAENLRNGFPNPYTENDSLNYINTIIDDDTQIARAIIVNNEAVGSITIIKQQDVYEKSAELGYWLSEDYWNKGILSKLIPEIIKIAFNELDIVRIFAEPFSYNTASIRVLEKSGFKLEGKKEKSIYKNGKYSDSYIYALLKD